MPRIELIEEVLYSPSDPIHWEVDNLPLKAILRRQNLINNAVDNLVAEVRDAIGTQGSMANRLNQSIDEDGNLKTTAVDQALHSIEEHTDTDDYVRMTKAQSDKLDGVASGASDVVLQVFTDDDTYVDLDAGVIQFKPSETVEVEVEAPNIVRFHMGFPAEAAHRHYYGQEPVHDDLMSPDYTNYKVNSIASEYVEGSLRVYVNGVRLFEDVEVYVPGALVDDPWTLLKATPDFEAGTFELSAAVSEDDVVRIDFDLSLA